MSKPHILLTNDDGIEAPHLFTLLETLQKHPWDLRILAPERQQSAMSHAITLHKPMRIRTKSPGVQSLSGTPADCVYVGSLHGPRPDLVISGPNDGYNLGTDVFYSGTVGAAIEAGLRGIPALAVSVDRKQDAACAAKLVAQLAERLLQTPLPPGIVLNVNVPPGAKEVVWTRVGKRHYKEEVQERIDPQGGSYFWIGGGPTGHDKEAGTDCHAVFEEGKASVTPLHFAPSSMQPMPDWKLSI